MVSRSSAPNKGPAEGSEALTPSLGGILTSCLDMLKIENPEIRKKAVEFVGNLSLSTVNAYGRWITAMKAIADSCAINGHTFSQSEVCDFLTVAAKGIDSKRSGIKTISDATFQVYKDIMENYQNAGSKLKANYPRIIVDMISVLDKGVDTRGETVGLYNIERYYQQRKSTAPTEDPEASYLMKAPAEQGKPKPAVVPASYRKELVENLEQITGRSKKDLEHSLSSLQAVDIKKLGDLSFNYKKLRKYTKMSGSSNFKKQVEKELGRKLTDNQLQHAINSIRKANTYIENVLDGKFVPHGTHGINHVKHNLEYGYQLMGLMEPRKRRS